MSLLHVLVIYNQRIQETQTLFQSYNTLLHCTRRMIRVPISYTPQDTAFGNKPLVNIRDLALALAGLAGTAKTYER